MLFKGAPARPRVVAEPDGLRRSVGKVSDEELRQMLAEHRLLL